MLFHLLMSSFKVIPANTVAIITPLLLILLIPSIIKIYTAYKQIVKYEYFLSIHYNSIIFIKLIYLYIRGVHYTHVNALTPRGAHIINPGSCGTSNQFHPYSDMFNIHTTTGTGTGKYEFYLILNYIWFYNILM